MTFLNVSLLDNTGGAFRLTPIESIPDKTKALMEWPRRRRAGLGLSRGQLGC